MRVVFDLDGTLADNARREHIAHRAHAARASGEPTGPIWDEFHTHIPDDHPIEPIAATLRALNDVAIIEIWTARPEKYQGITEAWMQKHEIPFDILKMRPANDWRKAYIIKLEWYLERQAWRRPHLVFEDHPETTKLLRAAGAVVAQVGEGHNA